MWISAFDALEDYPPPGVAIPRHLNLCSISKIVELGEAIMDGLFIPRPADKGAAFKLKDNHVPSIKLLTASSTIALSNRYCNIVGSEIFAFSLHNHQHGRGFEVPKQLVALAAAFVSHATVAAGFYLTICANFLWQVTFAAVFMSQCDSRRGIEMIPLTDLDEMSAGGREIWAIYREGILSSIGDTHSAINTALNVVAANIRRDNCMVQAIGLGMARRLQYFRDRENEQSAENNSSQNVSNEAEQLSLL